MEFRVEPIGQEEERQARANEILERLREMERRQKFSEAEGGEFAGEE
jgi:hypothetical protein